MREGDNFDPREWFNRVVLEKRKSEVIQQARSPANLASVVDPLSTEKLSPRPPQTPISFPLQETRQANRLGRRLAEISDVWDDVQESRRRDAVYKFLGAVFGVVTDYKGKRRRQLLRRAYRFAGLAFDEHQNPFAAIIRCTSDGQLDRKQISKYTRALMYVAQCKRSPSSVKRFMKRVGGINCCARRYARAQRATRKHPF